MCTAFPCSDYYGGSVPSPSRQPTVGLPAATLAGQRGGRFEDGSHVHHVPVGRIGAQLFPCSIATPTPQAFGVASYPAYVSRDRSRVALSWLGVHCSPARIHQVGAGSTLEGVQPLVHSRCTSLPRLPDPSRLAVPARPVVVRAACRPPPHAQGGQLRCGTCGSLSDPEGVAIAEAIRFEGDSNPDDEAILIAIVCPSGCLGQFSAAFGPSTAAPDAEVLQRLAHVVSK